MDWFTLTLIVTALILVVQYLWKKMTCDIEIFEKQGVPYTKPLLLVGNVLPLILRKKGMSDFIKDACAKYPNAKLVGMFTFTKPGYIICDPELAKRIGGADYEYFANRGIGMDPEVDPLMGNVLISLKDDMWKDMRATLSPAFTGSKMRQMFDLLPVVGQHMVEYYKNIAPEERTVNLLDVFGRFALDAIASTNFGVEVNSFKDRENSFYIKTREMVNFSSIWFYLRVVTCMMFKPVAKLFRIQVIPNHQISFFTDIIRETEKTREKQGIYRPDLIQMIMEIKKGRMERDESACDDMGFATCHEADLGQAKRNWNDQQLMSQAFIFFFAGYEIISATSALVAYSLALNPDIQHRLIDEIDRVDEKLAGKSLTYETIQQMKYLDMVITESFRYWNPADISDRECTKDYTLKNDNGDEITIKKGTGIIFAMPYLHAAEKYYENSDKFDPERFSDENKHKIIPGSYAPFGFGVRSCIGSRFALMEVKAIIYYLLKDFTVKKCEKTKVPLQFVKGFLAGKLTVDGIWLKLEPRMKQRV